MATAAALVPSRHDLMDLDEVGEVPRRERPMFFHHPIIKHRYCLTVYAEDYYPLEELYDMITCGGSVQPEHRELMLDYRPQQDGAPLVHLRHMDHDSRAVLTKAIIEVAPHMGGRPMPGLEMGSFLALHLGRFRVGSTLHPALQHERRELVLDLDIPDYDKGTAVRFCACRGKSEVCAQCWLFAEAAWAAVEYRTAMLHGEPLHANHEYYLWTFSGSKGLHAWCTDPQWDSIGEATRVQIAAYLSFVPTTLQEVNAHERAYIQYMYDFFLQRISCPSRQLLGQPETRRWLLEFLDAGKNPQIDRALQPVHDAWSRIASPRLEPGAPDVFMEAWCKYLPHPPLALQHRIVNGLLRPRLDMGVLKQSHSLKAPFSVHAQRLAIDLPLASVLLPYTLLPRVTVEELEANDAQSRPAELLAEGKAKFRQWLVRRYPGLAPKYPAPPAEEDDDDDDSSSLSSTEEGEANTANLTITEIMRMIPG